MRTIISRKRNATIRVCIDKMGVDFIFSGKCYYKDSFIPIIYYDINELIHQLREILVNNIVNDDVYSCKRYETDNMYLQEDKIRFSSNCAITEFETRYHKGDISTFLINIVHSDGSWLGFISFIEEGKITYFRSEAEFKKLLLSYASNLMRVNANIA